MKLKELRLDKNLSQKEIAQIIDTSDVNYNRYELEKIEPSIQTLIKLADYYDVSLDYLCDRKWNNQIGYIPDNKKEAVKILLQLNEINTIKLISYASGLLANQD